MDVFSGVRIVRSHAIMHVVINVCVVQCHASVHVVIGVRIVLCCPLVHNSTFLAFYFVPNSHCNKFIQLLPVAIFSHVLHRLPAAFEVWYLQRGEVRRGLP